MTKREIYPKLKPSEQIDKLIEKGVKFELMHKNDALTFLTNNNNYFKLTSYKKNFPLSSPSNGIPQYANLDFMHLVEISRMDMLLRYHLLRMCLDIEHSLKIFLIRQIEENVYEDGYDIVEDFISSVDPIKKKKIISDVTKNVSSIYYHDALSKYSISHDDEDIKEFPVWAFLETVSFGTLVDFMSFYNLKYNIFTSEIFHFLNKVKQVRNASAHNTCMLNNLYSSMSNTTKPNMKITKLLGDSSVNKKERSSRLSNEVLYQIVVVFYFHSSFVSSSHIKTMRYSELNDLMSSNTELVNQYFSKNDLIVSSFDMLHKVSQYLSKQFIVVDNMISP